ncbi:hypothetical protein BV898_19573, partial [Hypsibius exemplaris]
SSDLMTTSNLNTLHQTEREHTTKIFSAMKPDGQSNLKQTKMVSRMVAQSCPPPTPGSRKVGHVSVRCLSSGRGASRGGGRGGYQNVNPIRQEWSQRPTSYGPPPPRFTPPYLTSQQHPAMSNQSPYQSPQYQPPIAPGQSQQMFPQMEQSATMNAVQAGSSFSALPSTETATFYAGPQPVGQQQLEFVSEVTVSVAPEGLAMDSGRVLACPTFRPPLPRLRAEELAALEKEVGVAETTRLPGRLSNNQHINNQHINNQRFHDGDGSPERVDATATVTVPVDLRKIEATVACGGTDRVTVAENLTDQSLTVGRDGSAGPSGEMEGIVTDTRDQPRADGSDVSGTLPDNGEAVINDAKLAGDGRTQPPTTRGTILYPDRAAEAATDDGEDLPIWCPSAKKFDRNCYVPSLADISCYVPYMYLADRANRNLASETGLRCWAAVVLSVRRVQNIVGR